MFSRCDLMVLHRLPPLVALRRVLLPKLEAAAQRLMLDSHLGSALHPQHAAPARAGSGSTEMPRSGPFSPHKNENVANGSERGAQSERSDLPWKTRSSPGGVGGIGAGGLPLSPMSSSANFPHTLSPSHPLSPSLSTRSPGGLAGGGGSGGLAGVVGMPPLSLGIMGPTHQGGGMGGLGEMGGDREKPGVELEGKAAAVQGEFGYHCDADSGVVYVQC
jgi:hypothetical protein